MFTLKRPLLTVGIAALSSLLFLVPVQAFAASAPHSTSSSQVVVSTQKTGMVPQACPPTIRSGSTGSWVRSLQNTLNGRGYGPLQVDGIFGMRTGSAVGQFQRDNGLHDDEIVGPLTWAALGYC